MQAKPPTSAPSSLCRPDVRAHKKIQNPVEPGAGSEAAQESALIFLKILGPDLDSTLRFYPEPRPRGASSCIGTRAAEAIGGARRATAHPSQPSQNAHDRDGFRLRSARLAVAAKLCQGHAVGPQRRDADAERRA